MAIISKTKRKYFKRMYYRKMEVLLRSNSYKKTISRFIIAICFVISAILAGLLYLGR